MCQGKLGQKNEKVYGFTNWFPWGETWLELNQSSTSQNISVNSYVLWFLFTLRSYLSFPWAYCHEMHCITMQNFGIRLFHKNVENSFYYVTLNDTTWEVWCLYVYLVHGQLSLFFVFTSQFGCINNHSPLWTMIVKNTEKLLHPSQNTRKWSFKFMTILLRFILPIFSLQKFKGKQHVNISNVKFLLY